jgi:sugar phosphate permease
MAILLIEVATLAYLWGSSSWLPSYLLQAEHFSITNMGVIASLPFVTAVASGFLGGYIIDASYRLFLCLAVSGPGSPCCSSSARTPWALLLCG